MNIILFGPPGSGKGTQSSHLAKKFRLNHLSTGDILRSEIVSGSKLGKEASKYMNEGNLVPDEVIIEMVSQKLSVIDSVLLDGFPRTLNQAKALDKELLNLSKTINHVLYFDVPSEELIQRLSQRLSCRNCPSTFTKSENNPTCNSDSNCEKQDLYQREDDKPEAISIRMKNYTDLTEPLLNFYKEKNLMTNIDANKSIAEVSEQIDKIMHI